MPKTQRHNEVYNLWRRFATALGLMLFFVLPASALTSVFNADKISGCSPLVVHFNPAAPACTGCTYSWKFGTGSPVAGYNVSTSFLIAGTHVVTLTVTDGVTSSSSTKTITVYPTPVVSFTVDDMTICPGGSVTFTNTSNNGVPGPSEKVWSLGDGDTATGNVVTNMYALAGYYNVTLSVTNAQGCTSILPKLSYIHVYNTPVPGFSQNKYSVCNPPGSINFTNTTSGTPPYSWLWRFGDNGTSAATNPTHIYTATGSYPTKLVVTDGRGCMDSLTGPNVVHVGSVTGSFTYPDSACVFFPVSFTNTSSTHTFRNWDYGDGTTAATIDGSHTYTATGTYNVRLVVGNSPCADTVYHTIKIKGGPPGTFTTSPANPCNAPVTLTFTSDAPAGTHISWIFGYTPSGVPLTGIGNPISRMYIMDSIIKVTMFKTDPVLGCRDTVKLNDTLYDMFLKINASKDRGCAPLTVDFSHSFYTTQPEYMVQPYPFPLTSLTWDFGDGTSQDVGASTTHIYTDTGTFQVTISGITTNGCYAADTMWVVAGGHSSATFTASPLHVCYGDSVLYTAVVTEGVADSFVWNHEEVTSYSTTEIRKYTHELPGVWSATLTPYDRGCPGDTVFIEDYITVDSPKAIIHRDFHCSDRNVITFGDSSVGADARVWIFGDGDTSWTENPVHTYALPGTYLAFLTTYNSLSGCRDTMGDTLTIVIPVIDFTADKTSICSSDTITFTATDMNNSPGQHYGWYVDDTFTFYDTGGVFKYWFDQPGAYTVQLFTFDQTACHDTFTKTNYIVHGQPSPGFTSSAPKGCTPFTVTFTDTSTNVLPGLSFTNFHWDFGDGNSADLSTNTATHTYTVPGTFTVTEIMTNNMGCSDTTTREVISIRPHPVFIAGNTHPCIGAATTFANNSAGIVSSSWTFGDGGVSALHSPTHIYSDTGAYDVALTVVDTNGCTHTTNSIAYINVLKPVADFHMTDSVSVCEDFLCHFYNTTMGAVSYLWTFGDGNTSIADSPANYYTDPGIFDIRLIATNPYGCNDTATDRVTVYGYPGAFTYTPDSGCIPLTVYFSADLTNVPSITWDFADGNTSAVSSSDTITHTYTAPGAYVPKLILSDNEGCSTSSIGTDTIKVNAVVAKFATIPNPVCLGTPFNFVDSSKSYWSAVTTRMWVYDGITSYAASPSHSIGTPGIYPIHLQVTNGWGCTDTMDATLEVIYVAPITGIKSVCLGLITTLSDATAGGTWSSGDTATAKIVAGIVSGVAAGTATITYSALGCFVTAVVTVLPLPSAISGPTSLCAGKTITLGSSPGGSWSSSITGAAVVDPSTGVVSGIAAGTSVISYMSANSCYRTTTVTVNLSPGPIGGDTVVCSSSPTTLTNPVAGGTWSSSDIAVVTISGLGIATGVTPGTAIITYAIGTCVSTVTITIDNTIPAITGADTICIGSATTMSNSESGGTWSSGNLAIATIGGSTGIVEGLASGTTFVTYTLDGGCRDTLLLTVIPPPFAGTISGPTKVCLGRSITLSDTAIGGIWSSDNSNTSVNTAGSVTGVAPGTSTIRYTVLNRFCSTVAVKYVTVNALPMAGTISGALSLCAGAMTVLNDTVPGGTWSSSKTVIATIDSGSGSLSAHSVGTTLLTYTVTDTNGCTNNATAVLSVIPPPFSVSDAVKDVQCYAGSDGSIALAVSGAAPFEFLWSNGASTSGITNLAVGSYSVSVTQPATQCELIDSFIITQPDSFQITATMIPDTCQLARGSIEVTVTGGTAPYAFAWSGPNRISVSNPLISAIPAGIYTLTLTDAHTCADTFSATLTEDPCTTLVIHDVITPNGDGLNDYWVIERINLYPNNLVQLFDKWGDKVYEQRSYNNGWYGQGKNGNQLPDGTYFYVVKLNELNKTGGENEFTGTVLIKR